MLQFVCFSIVWYFVAFLLHLVVHEAGHLVMGLLTGYRFVSFRVFSLTIMKTEGKWQWKRYKLAGTGGQCIMELPEEQDPETASWFWYNAGGVLANLLLTLLVAVLCFPVSGVAGFSFCYMTALTGVIMVIMNGIPATWGGMVNDGHNIRTLWKHPAERQSFVRVLQIAGSISKGVRPSAMPREWFDNEAVTPQSSALAVNHRMLYLALLEDQGRYDEGCDVAEELLSEEIKTPKILRLEISSERVMLELLQTRRVSSALDKLWTKEVATYTEKNSKYSPIKSAVLFTHTLLGLHQPEKAEEYRQNLISRQQSFAFYGEVLTALRIIDDAKSRSEAISNN